MILEAQIYAILLLEIRMENQINVGNQNMQQMEQNEVSQTGQIQEKPKTNYLFLGKIVLVCFVVFGFGGYYLGTRSVFQNPQPVVKSPTPATTVETPSVTTPINENVNLKTYKNVQYNLAFDYPQNYVISKNQDCGNLINNQAGCLLSLTLDPTNGDDYTPKAEFWLLQGINSVNIFGQVSTISFDSQKRVWVLDNPTEVLSVWGRTKTGQEIIKSSNGGSCGSSYYYIIPKYETDEVAIFSVPQSYRLRCDNFTNDKSKETDCNNFYKSVIDQYNRGETTADTWLPENYLSSIYSEAENIVKSYREITK